MLSQGNTKVEADIEQPNPECTRKSAMTLQGLNISVGNPSYTATLTWFPSATATNLSHANPILLPHDCALSSQTISYQVNYQRTSSTNGTLLACNNVCVSVAVVSAIGESTDEHFSSIPVQR